MNETILQNGYPSLEELKQNGCLPSEERYQKGPVAVLECIQPIPCNPCDGACPFGAIRVGTPITNLPRLIEEKCTGCGRCISHCSGLAIFVVDKTYRPGLASVSFPHEYLPLPERGQMVEAVDRAGQTVCTAQVIRVADPPANDHTPVVTVAVPVELADVVRGMKRLPQENAGEDGQAAGRSISLEDPDDTIVCRCEEVTVGDIKRAIAEGAQTLTGIKRRTRAGMGLCQGRTCHMLIERMLKEHPQYRAMAVEPDTVRPPMVPVKMGVLGGECDDE